MELVVTTKDCGVKYGLVCFSSSLRAHDGCPAMKDVEPLSPQRLNREA